MSWSIEEHIGEGRPWPEQVVVYRGETDESLTYARRSLSDVNKMVELMDTLAAENAKLREQIHWLKKGDILHVLTDQEYIDQCERERLMQVSIDALDKENAKLRELMCDMYRSMDVSCQFGHAIPAGTMAHIKNRVIGLGVEVDG